MQHPLSHTQHHQQQHHSAAHSITCKAASSNSNTPAAPGRGGGGGDSDTSAFLQSIQQQFDTRAPKYDSDTSYHAPLAAALLDLLQLQPGGPTWVLDLAAGTGLVGLAAAAAVGPQGRVVLVDVSAGMLAQAKAKYDAATAVGGEATTPAANAAAATSPAGIAAVKIIQGDIEDLQICLQPDWLGSFDAITCSAATPFLRDPPAALAAWRAWLKQPGGQLAFNTFVPPALEDFGTFRRLLAEAGVAEVPEPFEALGSVEAVTSALKAAGYSHVQVTPETKERWMSAASLEAFAESTWVTAVTRNPFFTGPVQQQLAALTASNTPQASSAGSLEAAAGGGSGAQGPPAAAVLDNDGSL